MLFATPFVAELLMVVWALLDIPAWLVELGPVFETPAAPDPPTPLPDPSNPFRKPFGKRTSPLRLPKMLRIPKNELPELINELMRLIMLTSAAALPDATLPATVLPLAAALPDCAFTPTLLTMFPVDLAFTLSPDEF